MATINVPNSFKNIPFIGKFIAVAPQPKMQKDNVVINIIQEFKDKSRKDNQNWRDAITLVDDPENPQWQLLQDLYDYLKVDAHTHSLLELRKAATLSNRFYVYDVVTGEEQPEKTKLLQTEWFYNFLSEVLDSKAFGYTVAQLINPSIMKFDYIPRRNIVIQKDFVKLKVTEDKGVSLADAAIAPYIINVKNNYIYGYFNDLVPLILWKLNALMSWAEAAEKYGIPPLIATTTKSDDTSINRLNAMLKAAGESLTGVLPEGTKIEILKDSEKIDPQKMFDGLVERCNTEISKRILGGTMITDNGSSHSQSQVHQANFDEKIAEADKRSCEFVVTGQLLPMMIRFGNSFSPNDAFAFDRSQKLSPKEIVDMLDKILNHYDVDEEWIKKNTQIPITTKKQTTTANFKTAPTALAAALGAVGIMLPNYNKSACCGNETIEAAGFDSNAISQLADALMNNIWKNENPFVNQILLALQNNKVLTDALHNGWGNRRMQLTYDAIDNRCLAAMEYNLMDFSLAKSKADVLALNQLLIDKEKNNIRSESDFFKLAQQHLSTTNKDYLRTERAHAIAVGQNSSRYLQFKSEANKITQWVQWQTVGDSHVRASHAALNGKVFSLRENLTILPPKDWGCRCELIQYLGTPPKEIIYTNTQGLQTLGIEKGSKWDINRADAEQVFTANEMYVKKLDLANEINNLNYSSYQLKKYNEIKNEYPTITINPAITKNNATHLFITNAGNNRMGFEDYQKRNIVLTKKAFDQHTTLDKYINEGRHQLFPHISDVLNNPDEVYMLKRGMGNYQTNYIKFYSNKCLVVNTRLGNNNLEINTWYEMKAEEDVRKGLLIKNKKS